MPRTKTDRNPIISFYLSEPQARMLAKKDWLANDSESYPLLAEMFSDPDWRKSVSFPLDKTDAVASEFEAIYEREDAYRKDLAEKGISEGAKNQARVARSFSVLGAKCRRLAERRKARIPKTPGRPALGKDKLVCQSFHIRPDQVDRIEGLRKRWAKGSKSLVSRSEVLRLLLDRAEDE